MAAYTFQRIGKSLVKYFKPIRVAAPHLPDQAKTGSQNSPAGNDLAGENKAKFKLLKFKKPAQDKFAESRVNPAAGEETALELAAEARLPEKTPAQWLDLVVGLLGACKRASQKMKKKIGLQTYKNILLSRSKSKYQTLGSIVNTTSVIIEEQEEKKRVA